MPGVIDTTKTQRSLRDIDPFVTRFAQPSAPAEVTKSAAGDGRYRYVISTDQVDLMGDIVVQDGMKPVGPRIPAQVDHSGRIRDLIGHWSDIEVKPHKTYATLNLFPEGMSRTADLIRAMHEAEVRMAASIGFVPDDKEGGYELIRDEANDWVTGFKFNRSTLIETSIVVVPANPGALSVRSLEWAKRFSVDEQFVHARLRSFAMSDASQQMLRRMPAHDHVARAAAAVQKANAILERGAVK